MLFNYLKGFLIMSNTEKVITWNYVMETARTAYSLRKLGKFDEADSLIIALEELVKEGTITLEVYASNLN